jgi:hypothetical protein
MPSFSTNLIDTEIVQQGAKDEDLDFYWIPKNGYK